ncbi:MAG: RHS repeat-associated core domain-containing protein, partial [Gammaproteobacteria bacterium]
MTKVYDQDYAIRQVSSSSAGGLVIDAHVDVLGNMINASSTVGANPPTQVYQYDSLYRLTASQTGATPPVPLESYSYGKTGDRTSVALNGASATAYAYTPGTHRLQSVGGATRNYDAAGNTQSLNGATLTYDARNRLASVTGSVSATYTYNGKGERASKAVGGVTTTFLYGEGGQLLGEYANGNVQEYLYLDGTLVGVAYATAASPVGQLYYVETDHLGTPRVVIQPGATPSADVVLWKWDFFGSAFGTNQPSVQGLNLRFPGQYFDSETGLNYNYFRDYEPGTGRYVESDPIGLRGGINTYAYVKGNSLKYADPEGLEGYGSWTYCYQDGSPGPCAWDPHNSSYSGWEVCYAPVEGRPGSCLGETWLTCTDDCGNKHRYRYIKICTSAFSGGGVSFGNVTGMSGKDCKDPTRYEGPFLE